MSAVLATWPFTDHGISFFLLASIIAALACQRSGTGKWNYLLLGIMVGGLVGTKYTMAPIACLIVLLPLINNQKPFPLKTRNVLLAIFITAVIGGTWYVKNLILTGNPFYPLASNCFPGNGEWTPANSQFLTSRAGVKGFGHGLQDLFGIPIKTTFYWLKFEAHNPAATILISTVACASALLAGGYTSLSRPRLPIIAIAAVSLLVWFYSYQSNRLLLPILALALSLTPLEILTGHSVARKIYSLAILLSAACGLTWAIQWSWVTTGLTPPPLPYLLGAQDRNTFKYKSLTYARAFDFLNQQVQKSENVLLVGEHRIYGAKFIAIWNDWIDTPALLSILRKNKLRTIDELLDYLRQTKTPWILINERELEPQMESDFHPWFTAAEWNIFQQLRILKRPDVDTYNLPPGVTIIHLKIQN